MKDIFLKIKGHLAVGLPFAVYSKPGSDSVTGVFLKAEDHHNQSDYSKGGFVFAPFHGEAVFIPFDNAVIINEKIEEPTIKKLQPKSFDINKEAKSKFEALVAKSVEAIETGQFKKLVTSRTEAIEDEDLDITAIYEKLLNAYPAAFRYCFYSPQSGLWMGATPEQLLKVENNTVHTVALAGTQLFTDDEDVIWEAKERDEQQLVTDYILKGLSEHTADVGTTEPYTFRAGNLVHIKTDISAEIKAGKSVSEVINALHPTPAVCGLPKGDAKEFLLKNEGYDREFYSGYLGELNADASTGAPITDLFVNLRCMKIKDNVAHLYVGCGITKDSNPEKEFFETVNKSMTMRRVL
jgi:isochorismate synthase